VVGEAEEKLIEATREMSHVYHANKAGCGGILESLEYFHEFRSYFTKEEIEKTGMSASDNQLFMVYHRLPYDIKVMNERNERVSPQSPNGIIPSLLAFFSGGRTGTWVTWGRNRK